MENGFHRETEKGELFVWMACTPSVCPNCQLLVPRCCGLLWTTTTLAYWIVSLPLSLSSDILPLCRCPFLQTNSHKHGKVFFKSSVQVDLHVVPEEEDARWSSWIGITGMWRAPWRLLTFRLLICAHPPCASVSSSPLCPPCSGSQEGGTRSRRWCAEAVGTHRSQEMKGINWFKSKTSHT